MNRDKKIYQKTYTKQKLLQRQTYKAGNLKFR